MSYSIRETEDQFIVVNDMNRPVKADNATRASAERAINYLNGGDGLTKRERFAMAAMQGIIASLPEEWDGSSSEIANSSTAIADALIAELGKEPIELAAINASADDYEKCESCGSVEPNQDCWLCSDIGSDKS